MSGAESRQGKVQYCPVRPFRYPAGREEKPGCALLRPEPKRLRRTEQGVPAVAPRLPVAAGTPVAADETSAPQC